MKKVLATVLGLSLFAVAGAVSAANFSNVEFDNGDVEIQGTGGENVTTTFRLVIPAGEVVEYVQTDVLGDDLAPKCESVGGTKGLQEGTHFVDMEVKLPPNTGTYDLKVQGSGIFGGLRAIDCESNVVDTSTFNDALRVVGSNDADDIGGDSNMPSWLQKLIDALKPATPPAPVVSAACTELTNKMVGTVRAATNPANVKLQGFLLSEGASIPALAAGAAFGYYGEQTAAAVAWFAGINKCN